MNKRPDFENADEVVVYKVVRALKFERTILTVLHKNAEAQLGKDSLVDPIRTPGYYSLISTTIKAFEVVPIE